MESNKEVDMVKLENVLEPRPQAVEEQSPPAVENVGESVLPVPGDDQPNDLDQSDDQSDDSEQKSWQRNINIGELSVSDASNDPSDDEDTVEPEDDEETVREELIELPIIPEYDTDEESGGPMAQMVSSIEQTMRCRIQLLVRRLENGPTCSCDGCVCEAKPVNEEVTVAVETVESVSQPAMNGERKDPEGATDADAGGRQASEMPSDEPQSEVVPESVSKDGATVPEAGGRNEPPLKVVKNDAQKDTAGATVSEAGGQESENASVEPQSEVVKEGGQTGNAAGDASGAEPTHSEACEANVEVAAEVLPPTADQEAEPKDVVDTHLSA
ncbi:uncharacterized protein LOC118506472 isoform X2 [Anopheles stephensi]|uniref:uncharacterized protein LOC118506472 isoform X2 n=1 Tax=Anopheles stephensi TaxID=30069 RepID=UPI0007D311EC|nr:uncharacterized protein LOC118506472 isoform X2 [Anopheles stephensi]